MVRSRKRVSRRPSGCFLQLNSCNPFKAVSVRTAAKLFVLSGVPYFTAQTHELDELLRSSLPSGQVIQLSYQMFAVITPLLIPQCCHSRLIVVPQSYTAA